MSIFPHPSHSHPSCILPPPTPFALLPFPSLLSPCVIYCSTGWRFRADWWCSNLTVVSGAMLLFSFLPFFLCAWTLISSTHSPPLSFHWSPSTTVLDSISSSHLLILLLMKGPSISSSLYPCILFLILSTLPLPRKINSFLVLQKNLERPVPPLTTLNKASLSFSFSLFFPSFFSHSHPVTYTSSGHTLLDLHTFRSHFPLLRYSLLLSSRPSPIDRLGAKGKLWNSETTILGGGILRSILCKTWVKWIL